MRRVAKRWIRGPSDELAIAEGCYFDLKAGVYVCDFIETFCKQSKGRQWEGLPLTLLPWQSDFLTRLFGWKRADGLRRFRSAYLEVPKKNGKSTLLSALAVELLVADGEGGPEIFVNAYDREQASIIFDEAARMVRASPALAERLDVIDSRKRIVDRANNGKLVANSADVPSKDGGNASAVIFDELHRQRDRELWDIFEYAGAARLQPLRISITTAGDGQEGVWFEQREYSEAVNRGDVPDISHLGVIYRAQETDDFDSPATWRKANPSLGVTIPFEDFARDHAKAKQVGTEAWQLFLRLRLNVIASTSVKFLPADAWSKCSQPVRELAKGQPCYAGLDLASVNDLAALALVYGDPETGLDALVKFWLPLDNIEKLERKHKQPYREWAKRGFITLTAGEVIDYAAIRKAVNELAQVGELRKLFVDPYNATQLANQLLEEDGLELEYLRQGYLSLSAPTKELERLTLSRKLRHGGHPILKWMANNAVVETDAAGNVKLTKKKSRSKIDGMSALVNALAAYLATSDGPSVYETRGILTV